ncbi:MAG TPA: hypothetical protein VH481_02560 [Nitrososphaeraceae archaeon]
MTILLILIITVIAISLFWIQNFASAEITVIPPSRWQANPTNNSTALAWLENSTKSVLVVYKVPEDLSFPLMFVGPFMSQFLANQGVLESVDQASFGNGSHGYRYFLNLSSPSKLMNASSGLAPEGGVFGKIPKGTDVPYKGMLIITEKQGNLYAILFASPKDSFDFVLNGIKTTIDSIHFTNSINP